MSTIRPIIGVRSTFLMPAANVRSSERSTLNEKIRSRPYSPPSPGIVVKSKKSSSRDRAG
jgi:hypothetical protein